MVTKEERQGEGQTRSLGLIDTHSPHFCSGKPWLPPAGLLWSTEVLKNSYGRPESHTPDRTQKQQSQVMWQCDPDVSDETISGLVFEHV